MNKYIPWQLIQPRRGLLVLMLVGFGLRMLFFLYGAALLYGPGPTEYINGDTSSFVQSFLNLWYHNHYSFDLTQPQASFGRLPGYPFFVGAHYLLYGPAYYLQGIAFSQTCIDTVSIWLCYLIAQRLFPAQRAAAFLAALLYATYPFAIVWVTVTGTETVGIFFVLLWANWQLVTHSRPTPKRLIGLGIIIGLALLVRVYLGILLPISLLFIGQWWQKSWRRQLRHVVLIVLGFGAVYTWWPLRNIVLQHQVVLLKPSTAGYADMQEDMVAFLNWLHLWSNDDTYWLHEMMETRQITRFPAHVLENPADKVLLTKLIQQANHCGASFYARRHLRNALRYNNCNLSLSQGFDTLSAHYRQRHSWRAVVEVPLLNLRKALFKHNIMQSAGEHSIKSKLMSLVFAYRSVLLIAAMAGSWLHRRDPRLWPLLAFGTLLYVYICAYFRSLEMRYLLQADALSLIIVGYILAKYILPYIKLNVAELLAEGSSDR